MAARLCTTEASSPHRLADYSCGVFLLLLKAVLKSGKLCGIGCCRGNLLAAQDVLKGRWGVANSVTPPASAEPSSQLS